MSRTTTNLLTSIIFTHVTTPASFTLVMPSKYMWSDIIRFIIIVVLRVTWSINLPIDTNDLTSPGWNVCSEFGLKGISFWVLTVITFYKSLNAKGSSLIAKQLLALIGMMHVMPLLLEYKYNKCEQIAI